MQYARRGHELTGLRRRCNDQVTLPTPSSGKGEHKSKHDARTDEKG